MAVLYLDTSAVVKLYVHEEGTARMVQLAHPDEGHHLTILAITRTEFRAAVRRRERLGDLTEETANLLIEGFQDHLEDLFVLQPVSEIVFEYAARLIDEYKLRAYDGIQLAGALVVRDSASVGEVWFVTADADLIEPARNEGFVVIDPIQ